MVVTGSFLVASIISTLVIRVGFRNTISSRIRGGGKRPFERGGRCGHLCRRIGESWRHLRHIGRLGRKSIGRGSRRRGRGNIRRRGNVGRRGSKRRSRSIGRRGNVRRRHR